MDDAEGVVPAPRRLPVGTFKKLMKVPVLFHLLGGTGFVVGVGIAAVFFAVGKPVHDYLLSRDGQVTEGTVTRVTVSRMTKIKGRNPWLIWYTFQVGGVDWNGHSSTIDEGAVRGLQEGSRIEVEYLPSKPKVNRAKGTKASLFPVSGFLAPGFLVAAGGVIFLCGIGKVFRLRNLLMKGQAVSARITGGKVSKWIRIGRQHPVDVSYLFQDSRGIEWFGRTRVYFPPAGLEVVRGGELTIVYDYVNPRRSFAYELYDIDLSGK